MGHFIKDCPKLKQKVLLTGEETQGDVVLVTYHGNITATTPRSCGDFALNSCLEKLTTDSFMEGILDIGCVSSVCGDKWLEAWENITGLTLPTTPSSRSFVFGNSGVLKAFCEVLIPVDLGVMSIKIRA